MNEEEAFLRAIFLNASDNDLRLVYADWLEERGDPRGDLVRVQVALERGGHEPEQTAELRRREAELLAQFAEAWLRPLKERGWTAEFCRGLPEKVVPKRHPSAQLARVRRPRVHLRYEVEGADPPQRDLPFVVGVLADLSGPRRDGVPPLSDRNFRSIDRDNFNQVTSHVAPELHLAVPRAEGDGHLHVRLRFRQLDDFEPARLVEQVPELRQLVEARSLLLSAQLAAILHHPDFRRLEATWRGLHHLVFQSETDNTLKIRVFDVSKGELFEALGRSTNDAGPLFAACEAGIRNPGGDPYDLLVGDYAFDHGPEDVRLLERLARLAATAHAPFVAAASPRTFGGDRFTEPTADHNLAALFAGADYADWRSFRASADSRFVALTLPRVLARLPYGAAFRPVEEFVFEEFPDGAGQDYLWMNAAWVYAVRVTEAFARHGWLALTHGVEWGGTAHSLPVLPRPAGGLSAAETTIDESRAEELAQLGFLPLARSRDRDAFLTARSCHQPQPPPDPTGLALLAWLDYLLCLSRFVHCLTVMVRDRIAPPSEVEDVQRWLNEWLARYVVLGKTDPAEPPLVSYYRAVLSYDQTVPPLAEARVEVRPLPDRPGHHELVVWLRPIWQLEDPGVALRLTADVPR